MVKKVNGLTGIFFTSVFSATCCSWVSFWHSVCVLIYLFCMRALRVASWHASGCALSKTEFYDVPLCQKRQQEKEEPFALRAVCVQIGTVPSKLRHLQTGSVPLAWHRERGRKLLLNALGQALSLSLSSEGFFVLFFSFRFEPRFPAIVCAIIGGPLFIVGKCACARPCLCQSSSGISSSLVVLL